MEHRTNPRLAITYLDDGNQDGAGSQLLRIYGIYAISRSLGVAYIHSPIAHLGYHGLAALENDTPTGSLLDDLNRVFDIPSDIALPDERLIHNMVDADVDAIAAIDNLASDSGEFHLIRILYPFPVTDDNPELYRSIRAVSPFHYRGSDVFRLAIHVRRGDLFAIYSDWMLPNSYFVACILRFQRALRRLDIPFVCELYTEVASTTFEVTGDRHGIYDRLSEPVTFTPEMNHLEDFDGVPNLERYANLDTVETMRRMATADALILSHSSFSYLPALFHANGVVVYHPYWRSPMKDWFVSDDAGAFPEADLLARLESWKRASGAGSSMIETGRRAPLRPPALAMSGPMPNSDFDVEPLLRPFVEQSMPIRSVVAFGCKDLPPILPEELPGVRSTEAGCDAVALRIARDNDDGPTIVDAVLIPSTSHVSGAEWTSTLESIAQHSREMFESLSGDDLLLVPADVMNDNMPRIGDDFGFRAVAVLTPRSLGEAVDEHAWKLGRSLFDRGFVCVGSVGVGDANARCFLASDAIRSFNGLHVESRGYITMTTFWEGAGFGNRLWRYAFLKLFALRHSLTPALPKWDGAELFGLEDTSCVGLDLPRVDYPGFADNDRDLWYKDEPPTDIDVRGFFQEIPDCWRDHRPFLRHLFQPSPETVHALDVWRDAVTDGGRRPLVAISVRRGDYRELEHSGLPYFRLVPESWYLDWLRDLWPTLHDPLLYVASDEPEFVEPLFQEFEMIAAPLGSAAEPLPSHLGDFEVLRRADYLAICNSSFPRMAAVLGADAQRCFLPSFAAQSFVPYEPWIDPAFWARFGSSSTARDSTLIVGTDRLARPSPRGENWPMPTDRPIALPGLEVNEVKDGLIVFDVANDRVHYLNSTASIVFALCDGEHDAQVMADLVAAAFNLDDPPFAEVQSCLRNFADQGLLG